MKTPAPQRAAGRKALAAKGQALADGSEPVPDVAYLKKAIRSVGRLDPSKRPALAALIRKRARELKATNAPGVKGTWAFQGAGDDTEAVELAMHGIPKVRGRADVVASRAGAGRVSVRHASTGMRIGTVTSAGGSWDGTHSTGAATGSSPTMGGAMAGLIAWHNKMAAEKNAGLPAGQKAGAALAGDSDAIDLAGAMPRSVAAVTAGDGPRVTGMAGSKSATAAPAAASMSAEVAKVYKKLIAKGLSPKQAAAFAKRAAAMHARAASPKASAASRAA